MVTAVLDGEVIAESDDVVVIDGIHYFPRDSIRMDALVASERTSVCHWKGTASYFNVVARGTVAADSAFEYADPSDAAAELEGRIAFWQGVRIDNR